MKLGVHLPTFGPYASPDSITLLARTAEDLGFHSVWLFDHVLTPVDISTPYPYTAEGRYGVAPHDPYYEAVAVMAFVAGITSRVTIGTGVLLPLLRHPLLLAKQIASVDRLSGGRVILGVGAGWLREEYEALSLAFAGRGARLEEHVRVMRRAWAETISADEGPSYPHRPVGISPTPATGRVPLIFGGHSDRALDRVARLGDGWAAVTKPGPDPIAAYRERLDQLRRSCDAHGRDFEELLLLAQVPATSGLPFLEQLAGLGIHVCDLISYGRPPITAALLGKLPTEIG